MVALSSLLFVVFVVFIVVFGDFGAPKDFETRNAVILCFIICSYKSGKIEVQVYSYHSRIETDSFFQDNDNSTLTTPTSYASCILHVAFYLIFPSSKASKLVYYVNDYYIRTFSLLIVR